MNPAKPEPLNNCHKILILWIWSVYWTFWQCFFSFREGIKFYSACMTFNLNHFYYMHFCAVYCLNIYSGFSLKETHTHWCCRGLTYKTSCIKHGTFGVAGLSTNQCLHPPQSPLILDPVLTWLLFSPTLPIATAPLSASNHKLFS